MIDLSKIVVMVPDGSYELPTIIVRDLDDGIPSGVRHSLIGYRRCSPEEIAEALGEKMEKRLGIQAQGIFAVVILAALKGEKEGDK